VALRDRPDFRELIKGVDDGVVVSAIEPNGPAAKSELRPSDVITAVDGHHVSTAPELRAQVRSKPIGQTVTLDVVRGGKQLQVKVKPAEWNEPAVQAAANRETSKAGEPRRLGITPHLLTSELARQFKVDMTEGVIVLSVEKGSLAAQKGIKPGDIITSVNQQPVTSPKQYRELVAQGDLKKGIILNLLNPQGARFEILKEGGD
jgi:serine protease Do